MDVSETKEVVMETAQDIASFYFEQNPNTGKYHYQHMEAERMYALFAALFPRIPKNLGIRKKVQVYLALK